MSSVTDLADLLVETWSVYAHIILTRVIPVLVLYTFDQVFFIFITKFCQVSSHR